MNPISQAYYDAHAEDFRHPWRLWVEPFRIFGNLYFVGNADGASHLLDTGAGLVLFDSNYPTATPLLLYAIWRLGFSLADLRMIFHTHGHFDHFGATELLTRLTGAQTVLGEGDARMFRERPELTLREPDTYMWCPLFEPDITVSDSDVIRVGETEITAVDTAGHSPGAMSYFFPVTDGARTLTAVLHGGAGFNTLTRAFEREYRVSGAREAFYASIQRLKARQADIFLGNHTAQSRTLEKHARQLAPDCLANPFADRSQWPAYLASLEAQLEQLERDDP